MQYTLIKSNILHNFNILYKYNIPYKYNIIKVFFNNAYLTL